MVAAVAAGAFAAAAAGQTLQASNSSDSDADVTSLANATDASAALNTPTGTGGSTPVGAPQLLQVSHQSDATEEAERLAASAEFTKDRMAREAEAARRAAEEAARPKFVMPTEGSFTSGYGARWGTTHYGIDLANSIGTPIVAAADGVVIEAGAASGFGLWVRLQHSDGTVTVYGHIDTYSVSVGQTVKAGDQIATMGNRGYSTGPHLHFEVWDANGAKLDPLGWLNEHGVSI